MLGGQPYCFFSTIDRALYFNADGLNDAQCSNSHRCLCRSHYAPPNSPSPAPSPLLEEPTDPEETLPTQEAATTPFVEPTANAIEMLSSSEESSRATLIAVAAGGGGGLLLLLLVVAVAIEVCVCRPRRRRAAMTTVIPPTPTDSRAIARGVARTAATWDRKLSKWEGADVGAVHVSVGGDESSTSASQ